MLNSCGHSKAETVEHYPYRNITTFTRLYVYIGSEGGLRLILNIEQYEYMSSFENTAGITIMISDHNDATQLVRNSGYSVSAGTHSTLSMAYTEVL